MFLLHIVLCDEYVLWEHELLTQNSFDVGRKVLHITLISFFEMYDGRYFSVAKSGVTW